MAGNGSIPVNVMFGSVEYGFLSGCMEFLGVGREISAVAVVVLLSVAVAVAGNSIAAVCVWL